ncbi:hypothetical protein [Baekduia sp. Peel2402]|uniref:hypothetical protein n=1 Tax=Baekduia sp. Peel2402 TaxID=3458296 RepID=UPI00403E7929
MPRSTPPTTLALLLATIVVPIAGCGGGSSATATSSHAGTAATTPAKAAAPEVSPPGDIPDNQAFVRYAPPGAGFSVKVPEGWSRTQPDGAVVFTDKLNSIRLESRPPARRAGKASSVHRTAGTAQKLTYMMRSVPDPVTGKRVTDAVERYVFTKGGRTAVLTLSGPKGADNVDPWRIVTDSLRWSP